MTTKTTLTALAFAAAAFTATTLLASGSAPAGTSLVDKRPVPTQFLLKGLPKFGGPVGIGGHGPVCPPGSLCAPKPPMGGGDRDGDRDHDHDHDHDYGYYRDHDGYYRDHDYGYYRYRWYGWRDRPEIVIDGVPGVVEAAPAGPVAPAGRPVPARVPVAAPQPPAAPQTEAAPCNCLTKQNLPDGSVLFQDICTKESAIAPPPQATGAR